MSNDIAVTDDSIKTALKAWGENDLLYLAPGATIDARKGYVRTFLKNAAMSIFENEDLRKAMETPPGRLSLLRALQRGITSGLSLNPQDKQAALVAPGNGKIEFWPMKDGLVKGAYDTDKVSVILADTVYTNDGWALKKTAHGDDYDWTPATKDRGAPILYFALLVLKEGSRQIVFVMTEAEMQAWKLKYGKGLSSQKAMWNSNFQGAALKTVIRRILTTTYLGEKVQKLLDMDDEYAAHEPRDVTPKTKGATAESVTEELERRGEASPEPQPSAGGQQNLDDIF